MELQIEAALRGLQKRLRLRLPQVLSIIGTLIKLAIRTLNCFIVVNLLPIITVIIITIVMALLLNFAVTMLAKITKIGLSVTS